MLLDWSHAGTVGLDAAADLDLARRAAWLDAQADGGEANDNSLDQRRASAPERLDTATHDEPANAGDVYLAS